MSASPAADVRPDLSVVVPAYNEEGRLEPTLRDVAGYCRRTGRTAEIIVVDDGSRDQTATLVNRLSRELPEIRLIRLAANTGKGFAVRTGVVNSLGRLVLFTDADGATPISEIDRLETAIRAGAHVAIGSRVVKGEGVRVRAKWYRRLMGRSFHFLVTTLTVRGIDDTQCGFKLFQSDVAHDLFARLLMNRFSFDVELLLMAQLQGHQVAEVPVNWTHIAGSRINLFTDSLRMTWDLFAIRSYRMRGRYDKPHLRPLNFEGPPRAV